MNNVTGRSRRGAGRAVRGGAVNPARTDALEGAQCDLARILAGEPAADQDYRAADRYALLPPGQLDDGQVIAAAALERIRETATTPQAADESTATGG